MVCPVIELKAVRLGVVGPDALVPFNLRAAPDVVVRILFRVTDKAVVKKPRTKREQE
jgi:hypothetical protein